MAFNRNQMTPLSKGGARTAHTGKGSKQAPMAARAALTNAPPGGPTMNNYAKATPMANPAPNAPPLGMGGPLPPGLMG